MYSDNSVAKVRKLAPRPALQATRILGQLRERLRYLHYSLRTEESYVYWVRFFIQFHGLRHPREMGQPEVESFLTMLATGRRVSVSTHRQALSALLFLYREVLDQQLPWLAELGRPVPKKRIPSVLTVAEVERVFAFMDGEAALLARLLYGTGMRLNEALGLRVKDVDFARGLIIVREGKGGKDRVVMLPRTLVEPLREQLRHAHVLWAADRAAGRAGVHWRRSTREPGSPGPGIGYSRRPDFPRIHATGWRGGIICSRSAWHAHSSAPWRKPVSRNRCPSTPCATVSPRTCCRPARTSAPCRSCSVTPT